MTTSNHPVSIFSKIHSSKEKNFTSINTVTFDAMERGKAMFSHSPVFVGLIKVPLVHRLPLKYLSKNGRLAFELDLFIF